MHIMDCAPGAKSAIYDCPVWSRSDEKKSERIVNCEWHETRIHTHERNGRVCWRHETDKFTKQQHVTN